MAESIPVILNPAARSTKAARRLAAIEALQPSPRVHLTSRPGDAQLLAEGLVKEGHPLIVAAGGDGTMNEVLQGLCLANAAKAPGAEQARLGVLPMGTMNVFSLELELPGNDLVSCWERIASGHTREVDLWRANEHFFIQLAGVGVDAEIIRQTTWEAKKRLGPLSYVLSALRVMRGKSPMLTVEVPGEAPRVGSLVLVGNGHHYGGPFRLFERADSHDGLLDVLVFHQVGPWELAQLVRRLTTSGYSPSEDLEYLQAREFTVRASDPTSKGARVPMELDGELRGEAPVHFRPADRRLTVAV
ncbi:MAG: diacylglycerol kinase family lipid kinase [Verrucomicrobiaceae bacterium]|nr:diacylglycerol kinase family lipid kinase [Verrucomicrobiaceae bacterium]